MARAVGRFLFISQSQAARVRPHTEITIDGDKTLIFFTMEISKDSILFWAILEFDIKTNIQDHIKNALR